MIGTIKIILGKGVIVFIFTAIVAFVGNRIDSQINKGRNWFQVYVGLAGFIGSLSYVLLSL